MLIDDLLPVFHHNEIHARVVEAPLERTYAAARELDFSHSLPIRALFALRGMRLAERSVPGMLDAGFVLLAERPPHEFVIGLAAAGRRIVGTSAEEFAQPAGPRMIRIAMDFRLRGGAVHTEVVTETRVWCSDRATRLAFGLYWAVVRPFSGIIRREMLRCLAEQAEDDRPREPGTSM